MGSTLSSMAPKKEYGWQGTTVWKLTVLSVFSRTFFPLASAVTGSGKAIIYTFSQITVS